MAAEEFGSSTDRDPGIQRDDSQVAEGHQDVWPKSTCSVELQEDVWNICESSPQGLLQNKISREDSRLDFQCGRSEYCSSGSCPKCNTLIYQETKGSERITICFCLNSPLKHGRSQTGTPGRSPASAVIGAPSCHRLCSKSS